MSRCPDSPRGVISLARRTYSLHQSFPLHTWEIFGVGGVLGIEKKKRKKKIVKLIAEKLSRKICIGMGYLSLHISVIADA